MLTDALGSVIAIAKADQSLEIGYAYSPYGQTSKVGVENQQAGSENSSQYTGRENDQNGLYYYRARYYDPVLKRFISEDPIGLSGGINSYSYVGGNPVSMLDPTGLVAWDGTVGGAGLISGYGAAMYFFDLTSECKCNIQIRVRGYASMLAIGIGMTATASGGSSSFTDPFECPAANSANGYAGAISATVVTGGGASYGSMRLGSLSNSASLSTGMVGLDISAGFYQGASVVTSSEVKPCQCEAK